MFQPYIFMVTHKEFSENRGEGGAHCYKIYLVVESTIEQEVSFFGSKLKKPFPVFSTLGYP